MKNKANLTEEQINDLEMNRLAAMLPEEEYNEVATQREREP